MSSEEVAAPQQEECQQPHTASARHPHAVRFKDELSVEYPTSEEQSLTRHLKHTEQDAHEPFNEKEGGEDEEKKPDPAEKQPPPTVPGDLVPPDYIVLYKNPDEDDAGYKAVLEAMTNPQIFNSVRSVLRTTAFVAFPMFTIAIHPNTMYRLGFPQMLIASVISTSTHRGSLGEQIGVHTWTIRGITYMLILGTIYDSWHIHRHLGAWWGLIAFSIFLGGLCGNNNIRRFLFLYIFVYIMEMRMFDQYFGDVPAANAAWLAADLYMGTMIGIAALLFPYPIVTRKLIDMIIGKIFEGVGKMLAAMQVFVHSPDAHGAVIFFNDNSPFVKIEGILAAMPALLWFTNWEPSEFALRNPIRRLKLSLLRRIMALMYAAFSVGRTIVKLKRERSDHEAMENIRLEVRRKARQSVSGEHDEDTIDRDDSSVKAMMRCGYSRDEARRLIEEKRSLRENKLAHMKEFGVVLAQTTAKLGSTESKPEALVKGVPFDALREKDAAMRRNSRMEILQALRRHNGMVTRNRETRQQREKAEGRKGIGSDNNDDGSSCAIARSHAPHNEKKKQHAFERYQLNPEEASYIIDYTEVIDSVDVYIALNEVFFDLLMSMIAGEIQTFEEMMKDYRPCKSMWQRLLDYFIFEPWHDFWEEVWFRLTLARPYDIRVLKDAFKMTCAYLSACALNFELYTPPGGTYFFATTILLGLPVEEESLNIGVCRMAGNTLGCALGYLTLHNCKNLSEVIGLAMCFVFVLQCCKSHPLYGQAFLYASIITMAGVATSAMTIELLVRVLASTYTVCAYMLCCMFVFPVNPIKICWGYRIKLSKVVSEIIDEVAAAARMPIVYQEESGSEDGGLFMNQSMNWAMVTRSFESQQMFADMNYSVQLANRLLAMCAKWTPFAARQPVIRGMAQFPETDSKNIMEIHQRLVANMRLLVFGVQLVHRNRHSKPDVRLKRLLSGSVADFLDDFSGASRIMMQDFIDSIQQCRKWSYPKSLTNASYALRLKVRLHAILFEAYALFSVPLAHGTFALDSEELRQIREEGYTNTRVGEGDGVGEENKNGDSSTNGAITNNASFADRLLKTRRGAATIHDVDGKSTSSNELHRSMYQRNGTSVSADFNRTYANIAPIEEEHVEARVTVPLGQEDVKEELAETMRRERAEDRKNDRHWQNMAPSRATSLAPSRRASTLSTRPPPADHDVEGEQFEPVGPKREQSRIVKAVSKLVLNPPKEEVPIPEYRGPAFTYREDEHDLPVDTDFLALVCILSSCESMLTELAAMVASVNVISGYQKQLHECSLALPLIDKMSTAIKAHRKSVYQRYHYPDPPPQKGGPINSQENPWQDWTF